MSYRCEVCHVVSEPGQPRLIHTIHRHRPKTPFNSGAGTEIAREIPVCRTCRSLLEGTVSFDRIYRAHRKMRESRKDEERKEKAQRLLFRKEAERMPRKPILGKVNLQKVQIIPEPEEIMSAPARVFGRVVQPTTSTPIQEKVHHAANRKAPKRKPQVKSQGRKKRGT